MIKDHKAPSQLNQRLCIYSLFACIPGLKKNPSVRSLPAYLFKASDNRPVGAGGLSAGLNVVQRSFI